MGKIRLALCFFLNQIEAINLSFYFCLAVAKRKINITRYFELRESEHLTEMRRTAAEELWDLCRLFRIAGAGNFCPLAVPIRRGERRCQVVVRQLRADFSAIFAALFVARRLRISAGCVDTSEAQTAGKTCLPHGQWPIP